MKNASVLLLGIFGLLAVWRAEALPIYYNTSSASNALNTLASVATNGTGNATILSVSGANTNLVGRCTAVAVDAVSSKLFFIDGASNSIWSVKMDGTGLALVKKGLTNFPTDLALDVLNQKIYYTTCSTLQLSNTVQRVDYTGASNTVLFTATGAAGNGVSRCTSLAVDLLNSKIFLADAGAQKIWSMTLAGGSLTALATTTNSFPTSVALDITNQQVYFTASSPIQNSNFVQVIKYNGTGWTNRYTASGSVQRCTALDLDLVSRTIYLSDAGANTLWRLSMASNSVAPTAVLSAVPAAMKKVRWFNASTNRPAPGVTSIKITGTNITVNATNGYIGGTYYILMSTNLTTPLSQWKPIYTNILGGSGGFTLTASNSFARNIPRQFYVLRVQ